MAQRPAIDLLVIGADAAGCAAAGSAQRLGATTALIPTGLERKTEGYAPAPPNFVWRLLDLHRYGLRLDPADAQTQHLPDGTSVSIGPDAHKTARALGERQGALEFQWADFAASMKRARLRDRKARVARKNGRITDDRRTDDFFASANAVLDDRFEDEGIKTHLVSMLLAPFGLAGDEPGSSAALVELASGWPQRASGVSIDDALEAAARDRGVDMPLARVKTLAFIDGRIWSASLEDGSEIRARQAIASSALIADALGIYAEADGSPLRRMRGSEAMIRLSYQRVPELEGAAQDGVHHIASDRRAIIRARDAMIEGRLEETSPLTFEIIGKEIVARAPYCPARLAENGHFRDWTGQDLQILGRQAAAEIGKLLKADVGPPSAIDAKIGPDAAAGLRLRSLGAPPLPAPPPSLDMIGAAAALAMKVLRRD
jgi:hypothetical protein